MRNDKTISVEEKAELYEIGYRVIESSTYEDNDQARIVSDVYEKCQRRKDQSDKDIFHLLESSC